MVSQLAAATPATTTPPATTTTYHSLLPATAPTTPPGPPVLSVLCRTIAQLTAALDCGVSTIYCDFENPRHYHNAVSIFRTARPSPHATIFLATPRILKPGETAILKLITNTNPDGLLLRNLGALNYYKHRSDLKKIGDFSLNVANPITAQLLLTNASLDLLTISYDLNIDQVLDLIQAAPPAWFELTLHQHMPLFHMEHCVFCAFLSTGTTAKDCGRPCDQHLVQLRDRVGQLHRLHADVGCRNTLFNGIAQTGASFFASLHAAGLTRFRVELLDEDPATATTIIQTYQQLLAGTTDAPSLLVKVQALAKLGVTEGTLQAK